MSILTPISLDAFRGRLRTAEIKRSQEDAQLARQRKPSKADKARGDAMRAIEGKAMARRLGIRLEDLQ